MKRNLVELLVDPESKKPLKLTKTTLENGEVCSGLLDNECGRRYPIEAGIPRFVLTEDEGQQQTSDAFAFKWERRDSYDSLAVREGHTEWALERYGFESVKQWADFFNGREIVLDAGCGSGFSSSLWLDSPHWTGDCMWIGADISRAIDVAAERLAQVPNTHFIQADVNELPLPAGCCDAIFSEGVLHHTPSTRKAFMSTVRLLNTGGEFHFYVYRRKGPVREFTDDYVREQIADMSDEEAWAAMRSLTSLGKMLSELDVEVELEDDVPLLGIRSGKHDVQRLIYWHFAKLYWNETRSFEENVHVNFDWYRPRYAHRHTAEEVREWCADAGLAIEWFREEESGFTVRAVRH